MKNLGFALKGTVLTGIMIFSSPLPVHAGFDWTPPPAVPALTITHHDQQDVSAAPMVDVQATELTPSPDEQTPAPVVSPAPPVTSGEIIPENTAAVESAYPVETEQLQGSGPYAEALGFGSEIPLALALGQIVPADFVPSYASGVNPAVKLSWNGGKPWDQVLNEALAVHGLAAQIDGKSVVVHHSAGLESRAHPNTHMIPLEASESAPSGPEMEAQEKASMSAERPVVTGEGTANNYPRRTPPQRDLGAAQNQNGLYSETPAPPVMNDNKDIIVEQGAPEEAEAAASYEPAAAPALPVMPMTEGENKVQASAQPLKISYADEARGNSDELFARSAPAEASHVVQQKAILDPFEIRFWQADGQQNLKDVLVSWSGNAGVELIWDSGYDYKLPKGISLHGTFPDAVTQLFNLYGNAEPRPQGRLHPNLPKGPSVLLVENYP